MSHDDEPRLSLRPRERPLVAGQYRGTYLDCEAKRPTENAIDGLTAYGEPIAATNTHVDMAQEGYVWCKTGHWAKLEDVGNHPQHKTGKQSYCKTCEAALKKERRSVQAFQRIAFTERRRKKK